ncbi:hypothetical protein [Facilibium subflavum]|uniref:hypothetical protein n=1 Tax=Facilibium subflavum TaxID=2219058 RepID=UPI0013C2D15A|nr:hypothetical protein [Facilibium subflavum]
MSLYDGLMNASNIYISKNKSSSSRVFQLRHRHGDIGVRRAQKFQYLVKHISEHNPDRLREFTYAYLNQDRDQIQRILGLETSPNIDRSRIAVANQEAFTNYLLDEAVEIVLRGNDHRNSLRNYIQRAYDNYAFQAEYLEEDEKVLDSDGYSTYKDEDTSSYIAYENLGENKSDSNHAKSAHAVEHYYNSECDQHFFVKWLDPLDSRHRRIAEQNNMIAEVVYANIWRFLIGNRASQSKLVLNENGAIEGICSVGLPGFTPYGNLNKIDKEQTQGLIPILIAAYLLAEDDLHIYNFGRMNEGDEYCFGKIDHDYVISHWQEYTRQESLSRKFPIDTLADLLDETNTHPYNCLSKLLDMVQTLRFNPAHANARALCLGHSLRSQASSGSRPVTTTSRDLGTILRLGFSNDRNGKRTK